MVIVYYSKGCEKELGVTFFNGGYYEDAVKIADKHIQKYDDAVYYEIWDNEFYWSVINPRNNEKYRTRLEE